MDSHTPKNLSAQQDVRMRVASRVADTNASHSYTQGEVHAFSMHINNQLKDDPQVKNLLPIDPETLQLFDSVGNGVLLCKLINKAQPGTIFPKAINVENLNVFKIKENLTLAIASARAIGCICVNVHAANIIEKSEHIILGLLWQIIKVQLLGNIDLKHHPYLIRLKRDDEEIADLLKLSKEELLLRWFNYHLVNGKRNKISNFEGDLASGEAYTYLLHQICTQKCDLTGLSLNPEERCKKVISDSKQLGVPPNSIKHNDILNGNSKLNIIFIAHLFNNCPGLEPTEQEKIDAAGLIDDDNDPEASREERVFRMWINSLNLPDIYINNLIQDLRDGEVLCIVMDKLAPGKVDMKKVKAQLKNKMKFNKIQNANYAIQVAKDLGCQIVGIGGVDIVDGNKKLILAIVWQLMKKQQLECIGDMTENKLLEWANSRILDQQSKITSFKDKKLRTSQFFFKLLESIEPQIVNQDLVTPGQTDQEVMDNAKYVISVSRKINAAVFIVWEHIADVNSKFLMSFTASLYRCALEYKKK